VPAANPAASIIHPHHHTSTMIDATRPSISIARIALPFFVLTAASGAAVVSGILYEKQPSSAARKALPPAFSARSPDSGDLITPAFNVALIGRAGDAVIAGTAAPVAAVELLRNGEVLDRSITDQLGQFVMNPSRLPSGNYELTLSSRQANGKQATSRRSVAVTVQPSPPEQNIALKTSEKESVIPTKPVVVPSVVRQPSRARREAKGASGLGPKLFNQVVGSHQ
jgi:hypothetical protein